MKNMKWFVGAAAVLLAGSVLVHADDEAKPVKKPHAVRLTKPWSELTDLTDAEKKQILEIHGKANEEKKAIEVKEHEDIVALLTDDQKKELATLEAEAKKSGHEHEKEPTTKPAKE